MVKISVILPVYNCEHFIYKAINSVLNQTFEDFELIIVDDCSTDNTVGIIRKFNDKRIQLIVKETIIKINYSSYTIFKCIFL